LFGVRHAGVTSKTADWTFNQISPIVRIEGNTRHTFSFQDESREVVQVALRSPNSRPVDADIELWIGPDWTPLKIQCHTEDGAKLPIQSLVGTRNKLSNVEIRNVGVYNFPIDATCAYAINPLAEERETIQSDVDGVYCEGGSIKMWPITTNVDQVEVLITTQGKMLNCMIEFLNGPNNVKVKYQIFTNNGELNSLFLVFDTPGVGNSLRIRNLAPVEFPCEFFVKPTKTSAKEQGMDPVIGGW